jgi:hypothetical protein
VADEGDGLVAVLVDDELECFSHAGDDVVPGLAVGDSLLQVVGSGEFGGDVLRLGMA